MKKATNSHSYSRTHKCNLGGREQSMNRIPDTSDVLFSFIWLNNAPRSSSFFQYFFLFGTLIVFCCYFPFSSHHSIQFPKKCIMLLRTFLFNSSIRKKKLMGFSTKILAELIILSFYQTLLNRSNRSSNDDEY